MTPKQLTRQKQLIEAAEKLKVAKKQARIRARAESRQYFERKYAEYRAEALSEYQKVLFSSVDTVNEQRLAELMKGAEDVEDEEFAQ